MQPILPKKKIVKVSAKLISNRQRNNGHVPRKTQNRDRIRNVNMDRKKENLKVTKLGLEHNHTLHLPETLHLMVSQRKISELQVFEIEMADDAGIGPKAAHELASRTVGGKLNLCYTLRDHKNYLRTKRQREMAYGQAGSMLKYFQDKIAENPSFQYALQMDCEEQIANIFWADAKMIMDYAHFGDVVSFDTTFGTNKESRPFGVFVGFNHFRENVVFGEEER
jgi:zinc finger SWIM domain-containing protein 3